MEKKPCKLKFFLKEKKNQKSKIQKKGFFIFISKREAIIVENSFH